MALIEVKVPLVGDEKNKDEEATVSFWYFDEGDDVNEDDDLVEVVTDKADFRIPAPVTGKLVEKKVDEDDIVGVGDVVAIMETAD